MIYFEKLMKKKGVLYLDTKDNIIDKLKYIGLDLNSIPEFINKFEPIEYRPSKLDEEHIYKVYKYINVDDIQILLTPTNRLDNIVEKYR